MAVCITANNFLKTDSNINKFKNLQFRAVDNEDKYES